MSMLHLPIERLAELVDGGMTAFEREHLAACARCSGEFRAYTSLVSLAADERRRIAPPLTSWEALSSLLGEEGLIARPGLRAGRVSSTRTWAARAASVVILVTGGVLAGRLSSGLPLSEALAVRAFFAPAHSVGAPSQAVDVADGGTRFRSADDALAQLQQAQRTYGEAAAWLAAHDTSTSASDAEQYRNRLAALDGASRTFEAALTDSPRDPVLNQYFMATMNAREATMRRLGTALPVSSRLGRF